MSDQSKHANRCSVCKHPQKATIERAYLNCQRRSKIEKEYELPRDSLARHAKYFDLDSKRKTEDILWLVVEQGLEGLKEHPPSAAHVNDALKTIAKLRGEMIDRHQEIPSDFAGRSDGELDFYALHRRWPTEDELAEIQQLDTMAAEESEE